MGPTVIPAGKLPTELLARLLGPAALPAPELHLGPAVGEDACAIDVEAGTLVVATDPITFAGPSAGRSAVLVNANDVAATGARPRWFLATVLLPEGTREDSIERLFGEIHRGLGEVGATLVGGHTEVTGAVRRAVVVGQMLGLVEHRIVPTGGLRAGDIVLQVGAVPIEGAA
ncbi:MAG: AIR synthase related protein, partial [Candidatus Dormibacteraceae bacterium]